MRIWKYWQSVLMIRYCGCRYHSSHLVNITRTGEKPFVLFGEISILETDSPTKFANNWIICYDLNRIEIIILQRKEAFFVLINEQSDYSKPLLFISLKSIAELLSAFFFRSNTNEQLSILVVNCTWVSFDQLALQFASPSWTFAAGIPFNRTVKNNWSLGQWIVLGRTAKR